MDRQTASVTAEMTEAKVTIDRLVLEAKTLIASFEREELPKKADKVDLESLKL